MNLNNEYLHIWVFNGRAVASIPEFLDEKHRTALVWFDAHSGQKVPWPIMLPDETLLANRPKGIYKPSWSPYAPSVKQTLKSPYADRDPVHSEDGSWSYLYYQEEQEGKDTDSLTSNRAMQLCMRDEVPLEVLRQISPKPNPVYSVLGIAQIVGKAAGYYLLEGRSVDSRAATQKFIYLPEHDASAPISEFEDQRNYRLRKVVQRQGQPRFREQLMEIYDRKCAITNCDVQDVLEAAHVVPYRGVHTNHVSNGILLKADLHILFDEGLLAIDSETLAVRLSPILSSSNHYSPLDGNTISKGGAVLDRDLLRAHQHYCGF